MGTQLTSVSAEYRSAVEVHVVMAVHSAQCVLSDIAHTASRSHKQRALSCLETWVSQHGIQCTGALHAHTTLGFAGNNTSPLCSTECTKYVALVQADSRAGAGSAAVSR
jgi:hypothetical protein